jgi:hypothetical protein
MASAPVMKVKNRKKRVMITGLCVPERPGYSQCLVPELIAMPEAVLVIVGSFSQTGNQKK